MLIFDGLLTPALLGTGSYISVLSLSTCKRLRKVLVPLQGSTLRSAFNVISVPVAALTYRLVTNGVFYPSGSWVLAESSQLTSFWDTIFYRTTEL